MRSLIKSHRHKFLSPALKTFISVGLGSLISVSALPGQQIIPADEALHTLEDASSNALISEREEVEIVTDSNVAEAVARRPDLQFNNVTIDGERSSVSLDDIPADAINELEVLRAVTPDVDADSRGGSLNLSSNPTFNLEKPVIKADAYLWYSAGEDAWEQGSSATYGRAFGDIGFRMTASQTNEHDISESIHIEWQEAGENNSIYAPSYLFENFSEKWRILYNINGNIDFRISDSFYIFARANYQQNETVGYEPNIRYKFENGDYENLTSSSGSSMNAQVDRDLTGWESEYNQFDIQFGGFYNSDHFKLDFRIFDQTDSYEKPDWTIVEFKTTGVDLDYQLDEDNIPIPRQAGDAIVTDAASYAFDEYLSEHWQNYKDIFIGSLNAKYSFEIGESSAYLKAGFKYTTREKNQKSNSRIYTDYDGSFTLDEVVTDSDADSLIINGLNYGAFPILADSRVFLREHLDNFQYDIRRSAQKGDPATYFASEDINAAYLMLNLNRNRFRSIIGLRIEQTDLEYRAREVITDENHTYLRTEPRFGSNQYSHLFPSIHLRYFLGNRITLIGAWTATIKRPWYGDVVPYRFIDYDSLEINEGNPNLNPTLYDNFDFSIDYKLSDSSMFSVELFSKDVEDTVYWIVTDIDSGIYEGFTLGRNENGPSATERGIRLILSQNLAELHQALEGFSVILKTTLQDSETEYPERPGETLSVTYRPKNIVEATLTYNRNPFYVQLQYSHYTKELESVYSNKWQDLYHAPHNYLNLSDQL